MSLAAGDVKIFQPGFLILKLMKLGYIPSELLGAVPGPPLLCAGACVLELLEARGQKNMLLVVELLSWR